MHAQLTVSGGHMMNGLHVPKPAEVVTSFVRDQKFSKLLMEGNSAKKERKNSNHKLVHNPDIVDSSW